MYLSARHGGGRAAGCRFPGDAAEVGQPPSTAPEHADPRSGFRSAVRHRAASHVELGVRDLARSRAFYVDCLGLLVSDETGDALYLRGVEEHNHHSIVLRRSRAGEAHALGFKLASEEDLDRAAFWFGRRNLPTAFPEPPYQGRTLRTPTSSACIRNGPSAHRDRAACRACRRCARCGPGTADPERVGRLRRLNQKRRGRDLRRGELEAERMRLAGADCRSTIEWWLRSSTPRR